MSGEICPEGKSYTLPVDLEEEKEEFPAIDVGISAIQLERRGR